MQAALGVPLNYTESVSSVFEAFTQTGDYVRGGYLEDLAYILEQGIKVALVYGDRDFACNWIGGEEVSLAVPYSKISQFKTAGYTPVQVNNTYSGGLVRQYGNFSFTRVFQAGHEIPAYQPETAYEIFRRTMNNLDIATGKIATAGGGDSTVYATTGEMSTWTVKNEPPPPPQPTCYVLSLGTTCTNEQINAVFNGSAVIKNWVVVEQNKGSSGSGGSGTTPKKNEGMEKERWSRTGLVAYVIFTGSLVALGL